MIYNGKNRDRISFPLGGIGTGSVGLSGSGRLIDWEIFNRPNKNSLNDFSHFLVKVEKDDEVRDVRILNSDLPAPYTGDVVSHIHTGFGFGPNQITMAGLPHFESLEFDGNYPLAKLKFEDKNSIGKINLTALSPFIPMDSEESSLPAGIFEFEILNDTAEDLDYSIAFSLANPIAQKGIKNKFYDNGKVKAILLDNSQFDKNSVQYGNLCIATDSEDCSYQEYWYRGSWNDGLEIFWEDINNPGHLKNRTYEDDFSLNFKTCNDMSTLMAKKSIKAGCTGKFKFVLSWYYPNINKSWQVKYHPEEKIEDQPVWKNYYSKLANSSYEVVEHIFDKYNYLVDNTKLFSSSLSTSSLSEEALDAITANLSTLKSPTVLRLEDGSFYGFEGCFTDFGCCEGSCQHVWNYAYALPFLFPDLERSMRDLEFSYSVRENGGMGFRLQIPAGSGIDSYRACVDGQMGAIIKTYREWKISGDTKWLKDKWDILKKVMEYTWSKDNEDLWDPNKSGVLTGRQHHTLDMELFGPNSWLEGFYLLSLKACSEMAYAIGDIEYSKSLDAIYGKGKKWTDENLFNGEYFIQKIDLKDKSILEPFAHQLSVHGDNTIEAYWNFENEEIKYQIGDGCEIDQVLAQWHAICCNLETVFDDDKVKKALMSIYKNNYHEKMRDIINTWRIYSINDESGVIICSWPNSETRPKIPLPYNSETMNGFEYAYAALLLAYGFEKESNQVIKSVRDRFDGYKRNPFNEFECGSNYARSMASWSFLLIASGFKYDLTKNYLGFSPLNNSNDFNYFWSVDGAWGSFSFNDGTYKLKVAYGNLRLSEFEIKGISNKEVYLNMSDYIQVGDKFKFDLELTAGEEINIYCK